MTQKQIKTAPQHLKAYRFLLYKAYFDKGYSISSYVKYPMTIIGFVSWSVKVTLIIFSIYFFACFFVGWIWYKLHLVDTEQEIQNMFNPFVFEMRKRFK